MTRKFYQVKMRVLLLAGCVAIYAVGSPAATDQDTSSKSSVTKNSSSKTKSSNSGSNARNKQASTDGSSERSAASAPTGRTITTENFDASLIAQLIFDRTNVERRKAGLQPFSYMEGLGAAANGHSADMAGKDYFSHKGKGWFNRSTVNSRAEKSGVQTPALAENIVMLPIFKTQQVRTFYDSHGNISQRVDTDGNTYQQLADWALEQWMNSPGHRANILNPRLTYLGVGVAMGDHGGVPYIYMTQDFGGQ